MFKASSKVPILSTKQLSKLPYYPSFSHKSHPSVAELSHKLVEMVGLDMSRVHFTNSGSEANDTAMKFVLVL